MKKTDGTGFWAFWGGVFASIAFGSFFVVQTDMWPMTLEEWGALFLLADVMAMVYVVAYRTGGPSDWMPVVYVYSRSQSFRKRRY